MKAAVFFERDGVLNPCDVRAHHQIAPLRLEQFRVDESAVPLLKALKDDGFLLIVTTNQPAVGRGQLSRNELDMMHALLRRKLPVDDVFLCTSDDIHHPCYKPHPGMFLEAAFKWGIDLDRSFVISDKWPDAKAAQVVGCTSILIDSPWTGSDHHDFIVPSFTAAVGKIRQLHSAGTQLQVAAGG
jgi:D-glycero-D-manno-heptose 1,7-bisphosphate phosphatase